MTTEIEVYRSGERLGFEPGDTPGPPFATIVAPDGAEVAMMKGGHAVFEDPRALFLPGEELGYSAEHAYKNAKEGRHGLSLAT